MRSRIRRGGSRCGTEEGEQSTSTGTASTDSSCRGFLFIKKQILGHSKSTVHTNNRQPNKQRVDNERSKGCEEDEKEGEAGENQCDFPTGELSAEEYKRRRIDRAKEVEEAPSGEEREEEDEREGMGEEREGESEEEEEGVVEAEVGEVAPEPMDGGGKRVGTRREGGRVEELRPWPREGERAAQGGGQARDEEGEWRGGGGWRRGGGDWKNWWR